MPAVKFCGLTRPRDAAYAASIGASYAGVIFAGGPRKLNPDAAARVLEPVRGTAVRIVGVFGPSSPEAIAEVLKEVPLDIVQLHGDPSVAFVIEVREATGAEVWAVVRCANALPVAALPLFASADAVLLDAKVEHRLGGTGQAFDWRGVARDLGRRRGRLVLAGGLTPENVAGAVAIISPDVVDVSSGVELAPGVKDHPRMRAFMNAAR